MLFTDLPQFRKIARDKMTVRPMAFKIGLH
jgi:hypothetical protein